MPLECKLDKLAFLGSGFPLYFTFIKYCTISLLIVLISSGLFNIVSSAKVGEDCVEKDVYESMNTEEQAK